MSSTTEYPRLYGFDNLRWIMIARVVLFHVAAGYSGLPEFYYETQAGGNVGVLRWILQALPGMNVLFFIAGFFALPSLLRRGYWGFIRGKLYRLGVPYLLCVFFLAPLMPYLGYYSQSFNGLATASYWQFWTATLSSGFRFELTPTIFTTNTQFHPQHFWFLSELLQFLVLFALGHGAWLRWGPKTSANTASTASSLPDTQIIQRVSAGTLLITILVMTAVQAPIAFLELDGGLFMGLLKLEPMSWMNHAVFFGLGIYAYSRGWFIRLKAPSWPILSVLLLAVIGIGVVGYKTMGDSMSAQVFRILMPLWTTLGGVLFLLVAVVLALRFLNKPSRIRARLTQASYPTYLLHYPLILVFRLFLFAVDIPTEAKVLIVFLLASTSSVFLGLYLVRARPRLAAVALIGMHVVLLSVGLPRTSWSHVLLDRVAELHQLIPSQRPVQVFPAVDAKGKVIDATSAATPAIRVAWKKAGLYATIAPKGLVVIDNDGTVQQLNSEVKLEALVPTATGLLAIESYSGEIVEIDGEGNIGHRIVESTDKWERPWYLASAPMGGLFFSAGTGDRSGIYYIDTAMARPRQVAELAGARGLCLSVDGNTLYAVAAGDYNVWAFSVDSNGMLTQRRVVAELFRADGRYGRADLARTIDAEPEGMAVDVKGHLYIATNTGLQIFSVAGNLLGVVDFPDVPLSWNRARPLTVAFSGSASSMLYVSCGAQIFTLETNVNR